MLFRIDKNSGLRRELKKINKIRADSNKHCNFRSDSSIDVPEYDSSLSRDSNRDTYIQSSGFKGMNKLFHVVTNNIRTNKYQLNDAI